MIYVNMFRQHLCQKKTALINDWENIIAYREKSKQSEVLENKFSLFEKQLEGQGVQPQGNFVTVILI